MDTFLLVSLFASFAVPGDCARILAASSQSLVTRTQTRPKCRYHRPKLLVSCECCFTLFGFMQCIVITGASSGLGERLAMDYAKTVSYASVSAI